MRTLTPSSRRDGQRATHAGPGVIPGPDIWRAEMPRPRGRTRHGHLPNLLIIGAMKSGTTSLHAYLNEHPAVFMAQSKELFFWHRDDYAQRIDDYKRHFPVGATVRGESSVSYSIHPLYPHVPERIAGLVPDAKIIYVVRDPIERILSQYVHEWSDRRESRSLDEALRAPDDPCHPYVAPSRYATQLGEYLASFARSQVLVVDQLELLRSRRETLRKIFEFLAVDPSFDTPRFDVLSNTREEQRRPPWVVAEIRHARVVDGLLTRLPPSLTDPLRKSATRAIARKAPDLQLSDHTRANLANALAGEMRRLREITGQRFADWSV